MPSLLPVLACLSAAASAAALYASSHHCRWTIARNRSARSDSRRGLAPVGFALAGLSLWAWIAALGIGAGLCAMLASWMFALMALPCMTTCLQARRRVMRGGGS